MKKHLLLSALLISISSFAQFAPYHIAPSEIKSPFNIYQIANEVPGIRTGVTQIKLQTPYMNAQSFSTWYDFNIGYTNNVITSTGYTNIDPAIPVTDELRTTGSKTGNTYVALVETENGGWEAHERQTAYFDEKGKDTAWIIERHDGSAYNVNEKVVKTFDGSGRFLGYEKYTYFTTSDEWFIIASRNITYSGNERATDTIYTYGSTGEKEVYSYHTYSYVSGKLDSITYFTQTSPSSSSIIFEKGLKLTTGTDGGVDQIRTFIYKASNDSLYTDNRAIFTGGVVVPDTDTTTGIKELNAKDFSVYPVPATNILHIDAKETGIYTAQLFDIQGRNLLTQEVSNTSTINVSSLNNGVYVLVLQHANGEKTQKRILVSH